MLDLFVRMLAALFLLFRVCDSRLSIVNSVDTQTIVRSGEDATFWCKTNRPWFLCVWKGPAGLAITKTQGQAGGDCIEATDSRISLTGSGTICQFSINRIRIGDEGQYSCVLADMEDVQTSVTRNISLDVGVGATVKWVQGYSIQYGEGDKVDLQCKSEGGHPPPNVLIRSRGDVSLKELPTVSDGAFVSRSVSISGSDHQNNTELTCHAEQWGHNGVLLYNSTVAIIRLEVLSPLMLGCLDWWCGWELVIFVLLVVGLFILVACCGIYFFFGTRGKPYNVVMYESEENKASQQQLITKSETLTGIPEPAFTKQTVSNYTAFAGGLNTQDAGAQEINELEIINRRRYEESLLKKSKEFQYQEDLLKQTAKDQNVVASILSNIHSNTDQTDEYLKNNNSTTNIDLTSNHIDTKNSSQNIFDGTLNDISENKQNRGGLLIETEELTSYKTTTQTTIEERYRMKKKQNASSSDLSDSSSIGEDTVSYPLHQYHLKDCQNIKRLGRSYSKIIKDHLNQNPSIAVSETSIEFKVPRPKSRMTNGETSCQSSPFLGSKFRHEEIHEKSQFMHREETHFN